MMTGGSTSRKTQHHTTINSGAVSFSYPIGQGSFSDTCFLNHSIHMWMLSRHDMQPYLGWLKRDASLLVQAQHVLHQEAVCIVPRQEDILGSCITMRGVLDWCAAYGHDRNMRCRTINSAQDRDAMQGCERCCKSTPAGKPAGTKFRGTAFVLI